MPPAREKQLKPMVSKYFEEDWQPLDPPLSQQQGTLTFQYPSDSVFIEIPTRGAKLIDLRVQLGGAAVVLLIVLIPEVTQRVSICVQLHPVRGETYLPPNLRLSLLSQSGATLQEVTSKSHDNYIQLKRFESSFEKSFSMQLALGSAMMKKDFVLKRHAVDRQE